MAKSGERLAVISLTPRRDALKLAISRQPFVFEVFSVALLGAGALMIQVAIFETPHLFALGVNVWFKVGVLLGVVGLICGVGVVPFLVVRETYRTTKFNLDLINCAHQAFELRKLIDEAASITDDPEGLAKLTDELREAQQAWGRRVADVLMAHRQEAMIAYFLGDSARPAEGFGLPHATLERLAIVLDVRNRNLSEIIMKVS